MNHKLAISRSIRHILACVMAAALFVSGLAPAFADGDSLKEGARKAGHAAGSAVHDIGHGVKKAGKEIAHDAKKAGKEIGQAAKAGGQEFKRAVKGDKH